MTIVKNIKGCKTEIKILKGGVDFVIIIFTTKFNGDERRITLTNECFEKMMKIYKRTKQ